MRHTYYFSKYKVYCTFSQEVEVKPLKRNRVYLYICPRCKQSVKNLEKHISEHTDFYCQLEYGCRYCNVRKQSLSEMESHECLGYVKNSSVFFKCGQCPFKATQKGN